MIRLFVEPGVEKSWKQFRKQNPRYSIALDGYVKKSPCFDSSGPWLNLDHHSGVDRLATRSSSGQVLICLSQWMIKSFKKKGRITINVYANDCDEDVCLAYWLLQNHKRIDGTKSDHRIEHLVHLVDALDATGGTYPIDPKSLIRKRLNWVFEPYSIARKAGKISKMTGKEMLALIKAVGKRITRYVAGRSGKIPSDTRYKTLYVGKGWAMIREIGREGRLIACEKYGGACVTARQDPENKDVSHYVFLRMSPFVCFPIPDIYKEYNKRESIKLGLKKPGKHCGGSNTIGGSARRKGSRQTPEEVTKLVEFVINNKNKSPV
ncbi:MAG: hypothetical protein AAB389_04445 [Patescibacteria group bacterium]